MKSNCLLFGLLALAACTQDNLPAPDEEVKPEVKPEIGAGEKFLAVAPEFKVYSADKMVHPGTRVDVGIGGGKISYYWEKTDTIGVFPKADDQHAAFNGDQVYFNLNPLGDEVNRHASFDGGGWLVRKGFTYKAYTPFNKADGFGQDMKRMPVVFTGQKATATGNYLKNKIYMISEGTASADGALQFDFFTITSLGICNINLPEAGTISKLTFDFSEAGIMPFCAQGHFNLEMTGKENADKAITNTVPSATFTVAADVPCKGGTSVQIMFVQPPLKGIEGKTATVTLTYTDADGIERTPAVQYTFGKNWIAGDAYTFDFEFPTLVDAANHTVIVSKAGMLTDELVSQAMNGKGKLVIKGKINGNDIAVLRRFAGATSASLAATRGGTVAVSQLVELDMENAVLVDGGEHISVVANTFTEGIFSGCTSLEQIVLPSTLVKVEANVFAETGIVKVDLPSSVVAVEQDAFVNMPELTTVVVNSDPSCIVIDEGFLGSTDVEQTVNSTVVGNVTVELVDAHWVESAYDSKVEVIESTGVKEVVVMADRVKFDSEINPWKPGNGGELEGK